MLKNLLFQRQSGRVFYVVQFVLRTTRTNLFHGHPDTRLKIYAHNCYRRRWSSAQMSAMSTDAKGTFGDRQI